MGKREKLLEDWNRQPRFNADVQTVEAALRHYFRDGCRKAEGGSHQFRVSLPALYEHPHFVGGTRSIPVQGGQTVKSFYLKAHR